MESIMIELNHLDHNVEGDAVEGTTDCVRRETVT